MLNHNMIVVLTVVTTMPKRYFSFNFHVWYKRIYPNFAKGWKLGLLKLRLNHIYIFIVTSFVGTYFRSTVFPLVSAPGAY